MYKKLNNELQRENKNAREDWWTNECKELETMSGEILTETRKQANVGKNIQKNYTN